MTHATANLKTVYGALVSAWVLDENKFEWTVVVPPNTTATVHLPVQDGYTLTLDGQAIDGQVIDKQGVAGATRELAAGKYQFLGVKETR